MVPFTLMHLVQPGDVLHDRGLAHLRLVEPQADQTSNLDALDPDTPDAAPCLWRSGDRGRRLHAGQRGGYFGGNSGCSRRSHSAGCSSPTRICRRDSAWVRR